MTFTDGRDRFLYNYMVFAKKEISQTVGKKWYVQAGRKYFSFDEHWTDDHIKSKIKNWEKQKERFYLYRSITRTKLYESIMYVKRKFGVLAGEKDKLSNIK